MEWSCRVECAGTSIQDEVVAIDQTVARRARCMRVGVETADPPASSLVLCVRGE